MDDRGREITSTALQAPEARLRSRMWHVVNASRLRRLTQSSLLSTSFSPPPPPARSPLSDAKMPAATSQQQTLESLASIFPLTFPTPTPTTHSDLVSTKDLHREEDLLRNPSSFRHWWAAIQNLKEASSTLQKAEGPSDLAPEVAALLGPFSSPAARKSLQRQTYLYEAALAQFPLSFKLWKSYLQTRMSFVLGKLVVKKKAGGRKKFPEMRDALEDEAEDLERWEGGVDGIVGWEEWRLLIATFERALMWLPRVRLSTGSC